MLRTVAEETVRPDALTRSDEGTGSPSAMYSRTRAAKIRLDRSEGAISTRDLRLLSNYTQPHAHGVGWVSDTSTTNSRSSNGGADQISRARIARSRAAVRASAITSAGSTRCG